MLIDSRRNAQELKRGPASISLMTTENQQRIVRTPLQKKKRAGLWTNTTPTLDPQPSRERMKTMINHTSAGPHVRNSTNHTINDAVKRRAQSVINNKSIDAGTRAMIRYGLKTDDPWLPELVRRADAGETIIDDMDLLH